jgi:hypothetical protein
VIKPHRLRTVLLLGALALLPACAARSQVGLNAGSPSTSQSSLNVSVAGGSPMRALIGLGIAAAVLSSGGRNGAGVGNPSFVAEQDPGSGFGSGAGPALELDPGRKVNAQDCGRPIQDPSANLKCR